MSRSTFRLVIYPEISLGVQLGRLEVNRQGSHYANVGFGIWLPPDEWVQFIYETKIPTMGEANLWQDPSLSINS